MKIWWCDKHRSASHDGTFCQKTVAQALDRKYRSESDRLEPDPCRFGEMRLVSVDALVVEKVEGEWPEWVHEVANEINQGFIAVTSGRFMIPVPAVLDALAAAQDGEVPKDPWDYDP